MYSIRYYNKDLKRRDTGYYPDTPLTLNHTIMQGQPVRRLAAASHHAAAPQRVRRLAEGGLGALHGFAQEGGAVGRVAARRGCRGRQRRRARDRAGRREAPRDDVHDV